MKHTLLITVPRPEADHATKICAKPPTRDVVDRDSTVYDWEAKFADGMVVAVQVCADSEPDEHSCWCQAVLFQPDDAGGLHEISCSEVEERPWGDWVFKHEGNEYLVTVEVET